MSAQPAEHPQVDQILGQLKIARLSPDHSAVERLVQEYRDHFGLGPRDRDSERATAWLGMTYKGNVIAVFGERREDERTLEVTDAYFDGSPEGRAAVFRGLEMYKGELDSGAVDTLIATVLYANEPMWQAIIRETAQLPYALVFLFRRKEDGNDQH